MDEIVTIFRKSFEFVRKIWINIYPIENDTKVKKENERINDDENLINKKSLKKCRPNWTENFLTDEPILRDLLLNIPTEHDLFEIVCTINQLVYFYLIVRGISFRIFI